MDKTLMHMNSNILVAYSEDIADVHAWVTNEGFTQYAVSEEDGWYVISVPLSQEKLSTRFSWLQPLEGVQSL